MPSISLSRLITSIRSFDREEMILQGAFLVGLTSLVLLVGQTTRTETKGTRPAKVQPVETVSPKADPIA